MYDLQTFVKNIYFFKKCDIIKAEVDYMGEKLLLVVDDSTVITNFVERVFKEYYQVLKAKDGIEAIELIRNNFNKEFIGMFLDLNMPNFNGFQVLDVFKKNNLFQKIPVCILTGDDTKDSINKVFNYPKVDVLNKPFNEDTLRKSLEKIKIRKN